MDHPQHQMLKTVDLYENNGGLIVLTRAQNPCYDLKTTLKNTSKISRMTHKRVKIRKDIHANQDAEPVLSVIEVRKVCGGGRDGTIIFSREDTNL